MKKKLNIYLLALLLIILLTGCGTEEKESNKNENNKIQENQNTNKKEKEKENNNKNNSIVDDDEDNPPINNDNVTVSEIINCNNCVFAYFSAEGENAKKIGDSVTSNEYTSDIRTLKTSGGKQRHNFFGLVLNGNTISRAYACALKNNKIYCIEGSTNGAYHESNIAILNQIFTADQCKTLSDGHNYWCTDGSYNGNSKTSGYAALHYETSCTIYGSDSNTGKLICH